MKLRKPCEHKDEAHPEGRYEPHWGPCRFEECQGEPDHVKCPGGVFLPDDTLVIEKVDGEWPEWALFALGWIPEENRAKRAYTRILDALSVRDEL